MAHKPLRPCRHPGCGTLVRGGYCSAHRPKRAGRRESAAWHWMYNTVLWTRDLRPGQLLREPFCRSCARRGLRTPAADVDHITDHKGDWALFADRDNLESLCHSCHSRKTLRENGQNRGKNRG